MNSRNLLILLGVILVLITILLWSNTYLHGNLTLAHPLRNSKLESLLGCWLPLLLSPIYVALYLTMKVLEIVSSILLYLLDYNNYSIFQVYLRTTFRLVSKIVFPCAMVLIFLLPILAIIFVPEYYLYYISHNTGLSFVSSDKWLESANSTRLLMAQVIGGFAIIFGLYTAWMEYISNTHSKTADRFAAALDSLNSELELERLGAVYSLGDIMKRNKELAPGIVKALSGFIRNKHSDASQLEFVEANSDQVEKYLGIIFDEKDRIEFDDYYNYVLARNLIIRRILKPPYDLEAAITVLTSRKYKRYLRYTDQIDLSGAQLRSIYLINADFSHCILEKCDLSFSILVSADFSHALLGHSILIHADLSRANFNHASLHEADCRFADFDNCDMSEVILRGAKMTKDQLLRIRSLEFSSWPSDKLQEETIASRRKLHDLFTGRKQNKPND